MPRRFPCLALRASSVKTLRHRTCGIRKISRRLQHPLNCVFGDAVNCPGVPPCLALRASSVETLRHRTCVVRKISRGDLQHPLRCVFGDAVNCPGVPLVWPCVLPQWRPCVTGLVWFEKYREATCSTRCAYFFGDDAVNCPGVFPCLVLRASSVETLHHRTCGIRKRSRRLQCCLQTPLLTIFCYDSTSFKDQIQSRNDFSTPCPCFFHPLILVSSNLYYS
jgi:hypothetical protein